MESYINILFSADWEEIRFVAIGSRVVRDENEKTETGKDIFNITIEEAAEMNCSAASRGVWRYVKLYPNAASCGELNPADFAVCIPQSI